MLEKQYCTEKVIGLVGGIPCEQSKTGCQTESNNVDFNMYNSYVFRCIVSCFVSITRP